MMDPSDSLTTEITNILIDEGCTINKPAIKKVVDLVYNLQLGHVDGFEDHVTKQTKRIRIELEDRKAREAKA